MTETNQSEADEQWEAFSKTAAGKLFILLHTVLTEADCVVDGDKAHIDGEATLQELEEFVAVWKQYLEATQEEK